MNFNNILLLVVLIQLCSVANADSDLELVSVQTVTGEDFVSPNSTIRIRMTLRNNGPDVIPISATGASYKGGRGFRTIGLFENELTPPCVKSTFIFDTPPGQPSIISTEFRSPGALVPGQSLTCIGDMDVFPEAPALVQQDFFGASSIPDPNPANNKKTLTIRTSNGAYPVPLSGYVTWLLIVSLALIGSFASRKT